MKKILYLLLSNLFIFIIYPIIRFTNKKFYEKKILPSVINSTCNSRPIKYQRKKVVPNAVGTVLEIGIGSGHNLQYYNSSKVSKIYGVDPSNELNKLAKDKANKYNLDVDFIIASAEELPLDDNSIDTAVTTFSLCSIPDSQKALNEIYRVLKPSGKLIFSEHGLSPDKVVATIQNGIEFFYPKISGGCHANKDIPNLITSAKFNIDNLETMYLPGTQKFLGYNFWGTANK